MKRLFVAFEIDTQLRNALSRDATEFRGECGREGEALRWVPPERYHLTAVFLGNVEDERVSDLKEAIQAPELPQMDPVELGPSMVFPKPRNPRVLVRGVSAGAEPLSVAAERLRLSLRDKEFELDDKPFRPHITVAYVRKRPLSVIRGIAEKWAQRDPYGGGRGEVRQIVLYESVRKRGGPVYTPLLARRLTTS